MAIEVQSATYKHRVSQALLEINVEDLNDNQPIFVGLPYNFVFNVNTKMDSIVGQLQAVDLDIGFNGKVHYSIMAGNDNGYFNINPFNGQILLAKEIQLDNLNESLNFNLLAMAKDLGKNLFNDN